MVAGQLIVGWHGHAAQPRHSFKGLQATLLLLPMMLYPWRSSACSQASPPRPSPALINYALGAQQLRMAGRCQAAALTPSRSAYGCGRPLRHAAFAGRAVGGAEASLVAAIDQTSPLYTFFPHHAALVAPIHKVVAVIFAPWKLVKTFDLAYVLTSQPTTELSLSQLYTNRPARTRPGAPARWPTSC